MEALTDGVFAIVMTLMVFNISLPKDRPITNLRQELFALWPSFVAYAISFGMAGTRQTRLDARLGDHWADPADSLSDHSGQLRVRLRAGDPKESAVACGVAVRHQSRGESDLYADSVQDAKPAVGGGGHPDRVGANHLDRDRRLAARPLGRLGTKSVFCVGVAGDGTATVDHGDELVKREEFRNDRD